jgi:hypothetical protein
MASHHNTLDNHKAIRYKKKHPVSVSGSGVYRGTNELLKKSVLKNFLHFPKHLKKFLNYFFQAAIIIDPRHMYPFPRDLLPRRSSARLGW